MAYAEKKGRLGGATGCKKWAISGTAEAPSTTERQAPRTGEDTVYSPEKYRETEGRKDTTGYSVSGGNGKITGTNDSGVAFTISNDATITYQPGYLEGNGYYLQDGAYNKSGVLLIPGPVTIYSNAKFRSGYLKFATSGGAMTLDGDKGQRSINFSAGSNPTVSATTKTKTVLAQSGSTAMQNFAFDMEEDYI